MHASLSLVSCHPHVCACDCCQGSCIYLFIQQKLWHVLNQSDVCFTMQAYFEEKLAKEEQQNAIPESSSTS